MLVCAGCGCDTNNTILISWGIEPLPHNLPLCENCCIEVAKQTIKDYEDLLERME